MEIGITNEKWIEHLEQVVNQLYNAYLLETPVKEWPMGLYASVTDITLEMNEEAILALINQKA